MLDRVRRTGDWEEWLAFFLEGVRQTAELFPAARTPVAMVDLGPDRLKGVIRTIGLFNTKAENMLKTCRILLDEHGGEVPRRRLPR